MKKPVIIIAALVTALAGCKVDTAGLPGASNSSPSLLLGKWFIKSETVNGTSGGVAISLNVTSFSSQDYYTFNKDQSLYLSEVTLGDGVGTGSYSFDTTNNQLIITDFNGQATTNNITKLTTDSLVIAENLSTPATNTQTLETIHFARK